MDNLKSVEEKLHHLCCCWNALLLRNDANSPKRPPSSNRRPSDASAIVDSLPQPIYLLTRDEFAKQRLLAEHQLMQNSGGLSRFDSVGRRSFTAVASLDHVP